MKQNLYKTSGLIFFLMVFLISSATAQIEKDELIKDMKLDMVEAIELALANNPQINRALLSVDDADELVKIAYSELFPDITSSISYTRNVEIPVTFIPANIFDPTAPAGTLIPARFGADNNWIGGFSVSQNIFKGDAIIGVGTSAIFKAVQEESLRATMQQVVTQARLAYHRVLISEEQYRLQKAQVDRIQANLEENQARQKAGLIDSYDVLRLEVQLKNAEPQLIEAEYGVLEAYRDLKITLGLPLAMEFDVQGDLNAYNILNNGASVSENISLDRVDRLNAYSFEGGLTKEITDRRGDLRVVNARLDLKDKEISAIKSRFLPVISATYNLQWSAAENGRLNFFQVEGPDSNPIRFQTFGVNVSLPLFRGMERIANVKRSQIQRKDLEEQKRAASLNARNEIMSAREDLEQALETATARQQAVELAEEGYDRALKRLDQGLGSQLDVTEAEIQVREAEVNYAQMVFSYLNAKALYDQAVGLVPLVDQEIK